MSSITVAPPIATRWATSLATRLFGFVASTAAVTVLMVVAS